MTKEINLKIDGIDLTVDEGTTILNAARKASIVIPTLCYHEDLCVAGNCTGLCRGTKRCKKSCCIMCHAGFRRYGDIYQYRESSSCKETHC